MIVPIATGERQSHFTIIPFRGARNWHLLAGGRYLFAVACVALGLVELVFAKPLPDLHIWSGANIARMSGTTLAFFAAMTLGERWRRTASLLLGTHWAAAAVAAVVAGLAKPADPFSWVPMAKDALFAVAACAMAAPAQAGRILRATLGGCLVFFGFVHLGYHGLVATLIPRWLPFPGFWPFLTGAVMAVAGAAMLTGFKARFSALSIAAMFGTWLLLLHLERLSAAPTDSFEWTFALSAVAILGVSLMAASISPARVP